MRTLVGATTMFLVLSAISLAFLASAAVGRPLRADLTGAFTFGACPASAPAGATCLHDHVSGQISYLGRSTGEFDVVIDTAAGGVDGCAPITKHGFFIAASGDRLDVSAQGRYCFATLAATYTYSITGGSGLFNGATGTGTWLVPRPTTFKGTGGVGDEHLRGTIAYGSRAGLQSGLAVPNHSASVTGGKANVLLSCPHDSAGCSGTLTLSLGRRTSVRHPYRTRYMRAMTVGHVRFTLSAGVRHSLRVSLSASARCWLTRARDDRLRVTATIAHRHFTVTLVEQDRTRQRIR